MIMYDIRYVQASIVLQNSCLLDLLQKRIHLIFFVIITKELVIKLKHDHVTAENTRDDAAKVDGIGCEVMGTTATCWTSD